MLDVSLWEIAKIVLIFLGVPLVAGYLTRLWGERAKGVEWYEGKFLPRIAPVALWGLLFTVVLLFALQGETITSKPVDVLRIALPLLALLRPHVGGVLLHRLAHSTSATRATRRCRSPRPATTSSWPSRWPSGCIGVTSGQALAGVVGPLIEVPVLVGLVYVALWARKRFYPEVRPEG